MKRWLTVLLLSGAIWQGGQGVYIFAKAILAQWLIADAWRQSLETGTLVKPWPWADTWPVARLRLPRGDDLFVLAGAAGNSLAFGPGHESASALPGQPGVSVIGGHRDTHFRALKDLQLQESITVQSLDSQWHPYRIEKLAVVDSRNTTLNIPQEAAADHRQLLLITCYPFNALQPGGPLRYVVSATE